MTNTRFIHDIIKEFNFEFTREQIIEAINSSRLIPCNADSVMREVRKSGLVIFNRREEKYVKKN